MSAGRFLQGQKRASDPLDLELQVIVSLQMWVMGTERDPLRDQHRLLFTPPSPRPYPLPVLKTEAGGGGLL